MLKSQLLSSRTSFPNKLWLATCYKQCYMICCYTEQSLVFFDKGWILLTQHEASSGYKHDEHTPGLCITKMHTANINSHTNEHAGKRRSHIRPKLCPSDEKENNSKWSKQRSTNYSNDCICTNHLLTPQGQRCSSTAMPSGREWRSSAAITESNHL